jgi:hypothetical protein
MVHGQGSFDRAVREFTQDMGRDVQTKEHRSGPSAGKMCTRKLETSRHRWVPQRSIPSSASAEGEFDEEADHSEQTTAWKMLAHQAREQVVGVADWSAIWIRVRSDCPWRKT